MDTILGGGPTSKTQRYLIGAAVIVAILGMLWAYHRHRMPHIPPNAPITPVRGGAMHFGGACPHGCPPGCSHVQHFHSRSMCGPGEAAVTYREPDGTSSSFCRSFNDEPGPPTVCGAGWDPAASAEAQALATVGSYQHRPYGEKRLMGAVDAAFDANLGLSDAQLTSLMHQGATP